MADRGLSSGAITALGDTNVTQYNLLHLGFSANAYYTDAPHDILYDNGEGTTRTYVSSANCPNFPAIKETLGIRPSSLPLVFSGSAANHALTLTEDYKNREIHLYKFVQDNGDEEVTNGTFDSATTGWTAYGGAILSISSQQLKVQTPVSPAYCHAYQAITTIVGASYTITGDIVAGGTCLSSIIGVYENSDGTGTLESQSINGSIGGSVALSFVATGTTSYVCLRNNYVVASVYTLFDNISVKRKGYGTELFSGFVDSFSTNENARTGDSKVTWNCVSHWANWEAQNGRYINSVSQARLGFSGDRFFQFAGVTDSVLGYWGGTRNFGGRSASDVYRYTNVMNVQTNPAYIHAGPADISYDLSLFESPYNYQGRTATTNKLPVSYGESETEGTAIFRALSGSDLKYLWVVYALSEGECDSLNGDKIQFRDGDEIKAYDDSAFDSKIDYAFYSGTDAQTTATAPDEGSDLTNVTATKLVAASSDWTTFHKGGGVCYCIVRYEFDQNIFDAIPEPVFLLKGKKCINPNDTGAAAVYTNNPAWILRDYLSNETYGKGIPTANLTDFDAGATYAATTNIDHDAGAGGTPASIAVFGFSGMIDTNNSIKKNAELMLFAMRGYLTWVGGNYKLVIEREDGNPNLLTYSNEFDHADWSDNLTSLTVSASAGHDGGTAYDFNDNTGGYLGISQNNSADYDSSKDYTVSLYILKDAVGRATRFPALRLYFHGSVFDYVDLDIDTNTGDSNLAGTLSGSAVGGVEDYSSTHWRAWVSAKTGTPANDTVRWELFPAVGASAGWSYDPATTGTITADGAQLVEGDLPGIYWETEDTVIAGVYSFDEDNLTGDFSVSETGIESLLNLVEYEFIDPDMGYAPETVYADSATYLSEDDGRELRKKITNKYERDRYRAQNRATTILKHSRENIKGKLQCANADGIQIECGDIINITRTTQGWVNKAFRVHAMTIFPNGDVTIDEFREYTTSAFDWDVSAEVLPPSDTYSLDPFDVSTIAPTGVTIATATQRTADDGSTVDRGKITWTAPTGSIYLSHYEIQFQETNDGSTEWTDLPIVSAGDDLFITFPAIVGATYDAQVRAVTTLGKKSAWASASDHTITGTLVHGVNVDLIGGDTYNNSAYFFKTTFDALDAFTSTLAVVSSSGLTVTGTGSGTPDVQRSAGASLSKQALDYTKSRYFKAKVTLTDLSGLSGGKVLVIGGAGDIGFKLYKGTGATDIDIYSYHRGEESPTTPISNETFMKTVTSGDTVSLICEFVAGTEINFTVDATTNQETAKLPYDGMGGETPHKVFVASATINSNPCQFTLKEALSIQLP